MSMATASSEELMAVTFPANKSANLACNSALVPLITKLSPLTNLAMLAVVYCAKLKLIAVAFSLESITSTIALSKRSARLVLMFALLSLTVILVATLTLSAVASLRACAAVIDSLFVDKTMLSTLSLSNKAS